MADLESLIRLRKHSVDEKQKRLGEIYAKVEAIEARKKELTERLNNCLLYTSPSPRDRTRSRMPSSA